ncbi:type II toxin-antitoxin system VapC family toxin [Aquihabitans sp. G128]|uniref:type II toxin-antitoxin system VapC family toxin n=1 Tax=Aquihabitans sp. G128 TaxID=2849779 RepID=UPI001C24E985|nr:type II toxin-antitoxin system VapC family toxin [Aquihabitans sp. G128]QXC59498.1 type II toxin-antitoxin system VapC family toxin [Aquihabitans sp. G128]
MITYVDTSTLLKVLVDEPGSDVAEQVWEASPTLASVALVVVEARAALARAHRTGRLTTAQHRQAKTGMAGLLGDLTLVEVSPTVLDQAEDLAERDALRGSDAVHLAAALLVGAEVLSSADRELCDAAARHGLHVANPLDGLA